MHRELKADATCPPAKNLKSQQVKFNNFINQYNNERPHEALGMKTPSEVHVRSNREHPRYIRDWDYEKDLLTKMVTVNGCICWYQDQIMILTALSGKYVGLEDLEGGLWRVYYRHVELGILSEKTKRVYEVDDFNL